MTTTEEITSILDNAMSYAIDNHPEQKNELETLEADLNNQMSLIESTMQESLDKFRNKYKNIIPNDVNIFIQNIKDTQLSVDGINNAEIQVPIILNCIIIPSLRLTTEEQQILEEIPLSTILNFSNYIGINVLMEMHMFLEEAMSTRDNSIENILTTLYTSAYLD